jgi:glycosyltransferase involved in cell wall biosynthesis
MPRILHLLSHDADFETDRSSRALAASVGSEFSIVRHTIGPGGNYRNTPTATAQLRSMHEQFDLIHAFGPCALTAAAFASHRPIVFSPGAITRPGAVRWLRAIRTYRRVETVCATSTLRRILVEHGIPVANCHLIRPGVDFSRVKKRRDPELRKALGFSDTDRVILAAGESTRPAAHSDAAWAVGILHVADPKYKILIWGRGPSAKQLETLGHRWPLPGLITLAEQRLGRKMEFEDLLPAADVIMITARGPIATLPIAIAMAAGLPIVSTVTYTISELLEDHHTALMAPIHKPRLLARRVLDLEEEPGVQWKIADMARTEAFEYFAMTRFVNQFRTIYRQLSDGAPVSVPEQAPGAGLRFHGRA